jgi:hypothetical protein
MATWFFQVGPLVLDITDRDGHPWEIARNPHWPIEADGSIRLPD